MTTLTKKTHADTVRERRSPQNNPKAAPRASRSSFHRKPGTPKTKKSYRPETLYLPVEPQTRRTLRQAQESAVHSVSASKRAHGKTTGRMGIAPKTSQRNTQRHGYDLALSLGRTAIHAPTLSLPVLGPRWISGGLTLFLLVALYTMWTANTFKVSAAEVSGTQRLATADVEFMLGLNGQPIFDIMPAQLETNLRVAFPDLAGASVEIGFPNHVLVKVVERTPILSWYQDGQTTWIDPTGVAFQPRGSVDGLIQISAEGNPPAIAEDPSRSKYDQPFLSPEMVQAIMELYPQVPEGAPLIFDAKYGVGWQDPRGWSVFFGQTSQDIPMKKTVYQAILDTITQQGIQPTLISVEYLNTHSINKSE